MAGASSGSATTTKQFGLIVAYVLPGFIALAGLTPLFPAVARWLRPVGDGDFGVGPPLYAVLAATALGLILSCFRWLLIDHLHYWMGVRRPAWDDRRLDAVLGGFDYLVQSHFRYYEFCGNTLLALLFAYGFNRVLRTFTFLGIGTDLGMLVLLSVLFAASRDALAKYYTRTDRLVGRIAEKEFGGQSMFNGNDHNSGGASSPKPRPETKPQQTPKTPTKPQPADTKGAQSPK